MTDLIGTDRFGRPGGRARFPEWLAAAQNDPVAMKLFDHVDAMEAVPRIRRPSAIHTTDQIVVWRRATDGPLALPRKIWLVRSAAPSLDSRPK